MSSPSPTLAVASVAVALAVACVACGGYTGTARPVAPVALENDPGWRLVRGVPTVLQESERDCGVAVTSMVAGYWADGRAADVDVDVPAEGLTARQIADLLDAAGLEAFVVEGRASDLAREVEQGRPVIVGLAKPYGDDVLLHYEVVVGIHRATGAVVTIDPAHGLRQNTAQGFAAEWTATENVAIVVGALAGSARSEGPRASDLAPAGQTREKKRPSPHERRGP